MPPQHFDSPWVLAVWFSLSKSPISLLGPCALNRVDPSPGCRVGMSGQSTAFFWLCDCLKVEHVTSSRPMNFGPIAVTIGKEMCSFPPGGTKLIAGKAGVPRGHREGESTWELVRVSQYQRKQNWETKSNKFLIILLKDLGWIVPDCNSNTWHILNTMY